MQVRLYLWLIASSLIFPIIISSGGNLVDLWQVSIHQKKLQRFLSTVKLDCNQQNLLLTGDCHMCRK